MERNKAKIAIGIADNHPTLFKPFAFSLLGVVQFFERWAKDHNFPGEVDVILAEYGNVADMRNTIANQAVRDGYDYVFWMDSDQTFPHDCLPRMLGYCETQDIEAVSGLYTYKTPPYLPHIYPKLIEKNMKFALPTEFPLNQPMVIEGAGFGCLLMKTSVFARLEAPYFSMKFEDGKMVEGEDLPFCIKAKMKMILDPNIVCGHLRTGQFGIADFLKYNNLKVENDWVKTTKGKRDKMFGEMRKVIG